MARHQRLSQREPCDHLTQYAGKHLRCTMVVLEVAGRKPLAMKRIDYYMLSFDAERRIDSIELEKEARLAVKVLPPLPMKNDLINSLMLGVTLQRNAMNLNSSGFLSNTR